MKIFFHWHYFDNKFRLGEWVCVSNETKLVYEEDGGSGKAFTTVVVAGNAAGMSLPAFVIYGAKSVNPLWTRNGPDRAQYHCSAKGWINEDLFAKWLEHLFIPETASIQRPLLLIMDNLSAHISIKAIEIAQKHGIILLCLPPNTTHALQPFDVCPFGYVLLFLHTLMSHSYVVRLNIIKALEDVVVKSRSVVSD